MLKKVLDSRGNVVFKILLWSKRKHSLHRKLWIYFYFSRNTNLKEFLFVLIYFLQKKKKEEKENTEYYWSFNNISTIKVVLHTILSTCLLFFAVILITLLHPSLVRSSVLVYLKQKGTGEHWSRSEMFWVFHWQEWNVHGGITFLRW